MAPGARWIGCRNMDRDKRQSARTRSASSSSWRPPIPPARTASRSGRGRHQQPGACPAAKDGTDPDVLRAVVETRAAGSHLGGGGQRRQQLLDGRHRTEFLRSVVLRRAVSVADTIASFSSRGPVTADGSNRMKPDIVARESRSVLGPGGRVIRASPHLDGETARVGRRRACVVGVPSLAGRVTGDRGVAERDRRPARVRAAVRRGSRSSFRIPFRMGSADIAAAVSAALARRSRRLRRRVFR